MAIDEDLLGALRDHLGDRDVNEKRMFGGAGFMWRGNLLCGVMGAELLVRLDTATAVDVMGEDGAHPMVMGGRTSSGWVLVPVPAEDRARVFSTWLARATSYVETLPPK